MASDLVASASLLGELLVRTLTTTEERVQLALAIQLEARTNLGDILLEMGAIDAEDLAAALAIQRRMRSGDVVGACDETLRRAYERATATARAAVGDAHA